MIFKKHRFEQYSDTIARLFPEFSSKYGEYDHPDACCRTVTFQVTDSCNLACTYCYQINKGKRKMSLETAKKFVDMLLTGENGMSEYINVNNSPGIIIEFIGGEPFLEIELIDQICDYFMTRAIELEHQWAEFHCFSICSNGILYRDPRVQRFLSKHSVDLSLNITIDGNKELHDKCRIFHDGKPSYDIAIDAANDWMGRGYNLGSKITLAPENVSYLYEAIIHFIGNLGYDEINCNCVYEEGWQLPHAIELYNQLKKIADYMIDNNLEQDVYFAMFDDKLFRPMRAIDNRNWCFRAGTLISTPDGHKPIEDLSLTDRVYTKDGEIHEIENLMCHESFDNYSIKASGMFNTFTTGDHPYFCKRFSHVGNKGKYKYHKPDWTSVKDIKKGDKIALFVHEFGDKAIDPSIAYVVGRYIGDGWCSSTGYKLCCSFDEYEELNACLKAASVDYSFDRYSTVYQFNIFKSNTDLINILNECGHSAKEKRLPSNIFEWSEESVKSLLQGLFDADGNYKAGYQLQRLNTISFTLANELLEVIRSLGYFPTCSIDERAGESLIDGRNVMIRDRYEISFKVDNSSRFMDYDEKNGIVWTTVRRVERVDEPYVVYNLTVKDNHTFIANGALVHNCGGTGYMLACDPDGYLYPCIRYMESSLGTDQPPYRIGSINIGLAVRKCDKDKLHCLDCITRRSQSTDECFYCPIAHGCAWCSGYNYQLYGTANKRATFICVMHKARALANAYFWPKVYRKYNHTSKYECYIPDEWALEILSADEWEDLKSDDYLIHVTDKAEISRMINSGDGE